MFEKNGLNSKPFFIAEIGQNHNGDLKKALEYIKVFAQAGASAVKFQTRNNKFLFDSEAYEKPYESENAYANSYGAHREYLELDKDDYPVLIDACRQHGTLFMSTPFDEPSLEFLLQVGVDILKVASFDLGNLPFLKRIAKTQKPIVLSTGGGSERHVAESIKEITKYTDDLAILHCVSEYPCPPERLGLKKIAQLTKDYPQHSIGSSDHFNGILSGPIAYTFGARVFEKHVTLNRADKGTDHSFALEQKGFSDFIRDVNRTPLMYHSKPEDSLGIEPVFKKLGKSLVALTDIKQNEELSLDNLSGKIFNEVITPVRESYRFIGLQLKHDVTAGTPITLDMIVNKNAST